jgi:hypothetical protein
MTGITPKMTTSTFDTNLFLNFESNAKEREICFFSETIPIQIKIFSITGLTVLFFCIMMYLSFKLYFHKSNVKKNKEYKTKKIKKSKEK